MLPGIVFLPGSCGYLTSWQYLWAPFLPRYLSALPGFRECRWQPESYPFQDPQWTPGWICGTHLSYSPFSPPQLILTHPPSGVSMPEYLRHVCVLSKEFFVQLYLFKLLEIQGERPGEPLMPSSLWHHHKMFFEYLVFVKFLKLKVLVNTLQRRKKQVKELLSLGTL